MVIRHDWHKQDNQLNDKVNTHCYTDDDYFESELMKYSPAISFICF